MQRCSGLVCRTYLFGCIDPASTQCSPQSFAASCGGLRARVCPLCDPLRPIAPHQPTLSAHLLALGDFRLLYITLPRVAPPLPLPPPPSSPQTRHDTMQPQTDVNRHGLLSPRARSNARRRCHPEDIESSPAPALQECARAIKEAIREEGVPEQSTHEVVFVGRPMWELVSPVLDLSARAREKAASSG